jgi:hypothetical protein
MEIAIIIGGVFSVIVCILMIDWYNDFGDSDPIFCAACRYLNLQSNTERDDWRDILKGKEKYKISIVYGFIWPLILFGVLLKFIHVNTFKVYAEAQAKAKELKKLYVSTQDIYDFQEGDRITLKNGKEVTLGKFSLTNFADKTKTVFNWTDVKSNDSFRFRKQIQERDDKYLVFEKEADTFELKRKSFQDALSEQRKKIEEQYK